MDQTSQHLRPPHPRRPPANRSVSLLHPSRSLQPKQPSPPRNHHAGQDVQVGAHADQSTSSGSSPSSLKPLAGKDDSGESSNADKWFERSNNDVTAHADNDPPFFLQQSSSEDKTPPQGQMHALGRQNSSALHNSLPFQADLLRLGTDASSTDDFRSVIDDLTVQNKKLKRRLKRYEKLHDAHLKDEKLFEVRVHGLPAAKKKELEDMLRKFALGMQEQHAQNSSSLTNMPYDTLVPALRTQKTNTTHVTDSAYASASASGQGGSSALSGSASGHSKDAFKQSMQSRQQNIHSYLHDIPEGLFPTRTTPMSEKMKKKIVVRRLEQIFAGKGAGKGAHHHPLQQQEVSQLAAKADRSADEALGRHAAAEGNREARIMDEEMELSSIPNLSSSKELSQQEPSADSTLHIDPAQKTAERDFAEQSPKRISPEQRPTRPLDLDPQRAQVPFDNIQYIRHLGFSPSDQDDDRSPLEGHGWIYLNLLINMAQLHTISVTPEFVQKALQDYSTRFELSADGRKVRWRRSSGYVRTWSDADDTPSNSLDGSSGNQSPRKRAKLSHNTTSDPPGTRHRRLVPQEKNDKLMYTPLFFHRTSDDSDVSSSSYSDDEDTADSSHPLPNFGADAPGMASGSGMNGENGGRTLPLRRNRKRENGPIIFYNNARFCTDLSGDNKTEAAMVYNPIMYHVVSTQAVGSSPDSVTGESIAEKRGPLNDAQSLPEAMDLSDNPIPASMEVDFPPQTPMTSGSERSPLDMEASGIGGVCPADNFSINVRTHHARTDQAAPQPSRRSLPTRYPDYLAKILTKDGGASHKSRSAFHKQVVSTSKRDLAPSELPPASCFIPMDDTDSEYESENESEMFIPHAALDAPPPSAAPQMIQLPSWDSEDEEANKFDDEDEDGDDDNVSEGSLDFLATARELDPELIRESERLYDAEMAERLADDIPAGSSAATAGGGSGFTSPASGVDPEEATAARKAYREKHAKSRAVAPSFRRAQTHDSMVVNDG